LGQSAPVVLALIVSVHHCVDGQNHFSGVPTAFYAMVLLMAAIAYDLLQMVIIRSQGPDSMLKRAIGRDWKGKLSPMLYIIAIVATLGSSWIAQSLLVIAALRWIIPDRRYREALRCISRSIDSSTITRSAFVSQKTTVFGLR
jgi:uncharacterized membrane protein